MVGLWVITPIYQNIYVGYNSLTNHLLNSWNILVETNFQVKTRCFREGKSTMAPNMIRLPTTSRCFKDLGVGPTNQKNQSNGDYESRWAPDPVMKTDSLDP